MKIKIVEDLEFPIDTIIQTFAQIGRKGAGMTPSQYSAGSGGFSNSISRLNTFGILTRNKGVIKLNQELLDI